MTPPNTLEAELTYVPEYIEQALSDIYEHLSYPFSGNSPNEIFNSFLSEIIDANINKKLVLIWITKNYNDKKSVLFNDANLGYMLDNSYVFRNVDV